MKRNVFCGILLALAAVTAVGAVTVLGPCVHEDGSEAACAGAGRAVFCGGCVLAVLAAAMLVIRQPSVRMILFFLSLCTAAAGIAFPGTIFPVCGMSTMRCRAVMQPAMVILFACGLIVSAGGLIVERKRIRREKA